MRTTLMMACPIARSAARRCHAIGSVVWLAACVSAMLAVLAAEGSAQLVVDRATGAVSLSATGSVEVNGYSISSENGLLSPEAWSSLADQSVDGWFEANPRSQMLSELNPTGFVDPGAAAVNLGNAYSGISAGPSSEDLTLQYSLSDGSVVDGTVEYAGPINDLVLRIDPELGAANIELLSNNVGPLDIIGYSIFSDSGSLAEANLSGLGAGWTAASPTSSAIAELSLDGSMVFSTNTTASIGNIFTPGGTQDLRFEFATAGLELLQGTVAYGGGTSPPPVSLPGDADGDGDVDFDDFVILSNTFNQAVDPPGSGADFSGNGVVDFDDFVALSNNFGQTAAASVPEPSMGSVALVAAMLLACLTRQRRVTQYGLMVVPLMISFAASDALMALDFETRMIVLDANNPGSNATIDTAVEARGILNGTITDVNIGEDIVGTVDVVDFAGGGGALGVNNAYPNGVTDESLSDFAVQVTAFLEIPAGDWNIAFNSDDGGILTMPRVEFLTRTNENTPTGLPGELVFNAARGAGTWTAGSFSVPAGETLRTEFEILMFERGGGDLLEVAVLDGEVQGNSDWNSFGIELEDGTLGWTLLENGPASGDFNWDDQVDFDDFVVLANNFGTGTSFAQGDNNGDARVDLHDFVSLLPLLTPPANASAVPEPGGGLLLGLAGLSLLIARQRRQDAHERCPIEADATIGSAATR